MAVDEHNPPNTEDERDPASVDTLLEHHAKGFPASFVRLVTPIKGTKHLDYRDLVEEHFAVFDSRFALMLIGYLCASFKSEPDFVDLRSTLIDIAARLYPTLA